MCPQAAVWAPNVTAFMSTDMLGCLTATRGECGEAMSGPSSLPLDATGQFNRVSVKLVTGNTIQKASKVSNQIKATKVKKTKIKPSNSGPRRPEK